MTKPKNEQPTPVIVGGLITSVTTAPYASTVEIEPLYWPQCLVGDALVLPMIDDLRAVGYMSMAEWLHPPVDLDYDGQVRSRLVVTHKERFNQWLSFACPLYAGLFILPIIKDGIMVKALCFASKDQAKKHVALCFDPLSVIYTNLKNGTFAPEHIQLEFAVFDPIIYWRDKK